jgi:hypothetical protein
MMKTLRKILFIGVIIFALIFASAYAFLLLRGKAVIIQQLEGLTHRKVNLGYAGLTLPLNLEIRKLDIPGLAKVDYAYVSPSILGLLSGNIVLNDLKLIKPEFVYEKTAAKTQESSADINPPLVLATYQPRVIPQKRQSLRLVIKHLNIKDGKLDFVDHTVGSDGIKITVKDIDFDLTNLYMYPYSVVTDFAFSGKIPWLQGQQEGKIEAEGWLNLFKRDMQATLRIADIDGIYLYPYYSQWVDLEKARIEKAKLNLTSNIKSVDNNLTAACHLELTDIVFKPRPDEEAQDKAEKIAAAVLDIFKVLNKGKIVFNFTIKTKMINPAFSLNDIKDAFEMRLAEGRKNNHITTAMLQLPGRLVGGTVKSATDLSRAFIDGVFSVGNEVKKAFEVAFKREKEQKE